MLAYVVWRRSAAALPGWRDRFVGKDAVMYPSIDPYGHLEVSDGHAVYWEVVGSPSGVPAVWLHGGPGAPASPGSRRNFNPARFRAVIFDQRGCGRSRHNYGDIRPRPFCMRQDRTRLLVSGLLTCFFLAYLVTPLQNCNALLTNSAGCYGAPEPVVCGR
jgi:hypothetical protein